MSKYAGSLDTNTLLRLLLNDVPAQNELVVQLLESTSDLYRVEDTAIIEVVFVLERAYRFNRNEINEAVSDLIAMTQITCNQDLFAKALLLFTKNTQLSFEDCCLAVYAELNDAMPLWTFDQKLAKQASGVKLIVVKG